MERTKKINVKELLIHKAKAYMEQTIDPDLELNNIYITFFEETIYITI